MSYSQMFHLLKEENKGKIVFVNAGVFYIAIEEDAVLYNEIADYCFNKLRGKEFVAIDGCIRDNNIKIQNIEMFETFSNFKC